MNSNNKLLDTLLSQHAELRKILVVINEACDKDSASAEVLFEELSQFRKNLTEHLELEDSVFYPEVFKVLKEHGEDTKKTEDFVAQMKELGVLVFGYLDAYNTKEKISQNMEEFTKNTQDMSSKILLRISAEEQGVYMYLA